jgi:hypothetical protein
MRSCYRLNAEISVYLLFSHFQRLRRSTSQTLPAAPGQDFSAALATNQADLNTR